MGIFGNKQQDDLQDGAAQPAEQIHPVNTDGVLTQASPVAAAVVQPVPAAGNDAGDYIVTDPPVQPAPNDPVTPAPSADPDPVADQPAVVETPEPAAMPSSTIPVIESEKPAEQTAPEVLPQTPAEPKPVPDMTQASSSIPSDLNTIKQEALAELSPIVDHLDQSPEDKFNTTMMLLQSTDDKNLVRVAYDAAKAIPDEKVRARALLDIVNEITYFQGKS